MTIGGWVVFIINLIIYSDNSLKFSLKQFEYCIIGTRIEFNRFDFNISWLLAETII